MLHPCSPLLALMKFNCIMWNYFCYNNKWLYTAHTHEVTATQVLGRVGNTCWQYFCVYKALTAVVGDIGCTSCSRRHEKYQCIIAYLMSQQKKKKSIEVTESNETRLFHSNKTKIVNGVFSSKLEFQSLVSEFDLWLMSAKVNCNRVTESTPVNVHHPA